MRKNRPRLETDAHWLGHARWSSPCSLDLGNPPTPDASITSKRTIAMCSQKSITLQRTSATSNLAIPGLQKGSNSDLFGR
jgi:hypothetical protein